MDIFTKFDKKELILSLARIAFSVIIAGYLLSCLFLYMEQEKLIFRTVTITEDEVLEINEFYKSTTEEIRIKTPDGVLLHGWLNKEISHNPTPLVIYFGGNAEELSTAIPDKNLYFGYSLALINYRGYGISSGEPSEESLFNDALLIYDTLSVRKDIDKTKIVIMGRSLGSGVATYLASKRDNIGVVLVSPIDSVLSVAEGLYPNLPMKYLLKHKFDSISLAPSIDTPVLMLASDRDKIIPIKHSQSLFDAWGSNFKKPKKEMLTFNGTGHNNIALSRDYWMEIGKFLKSLLM